MKKIWVALMTFALAISSAVAADSARGTPAEAEAMV
jgi:hypothetical protein